MGRKSRDEDTRLTNRLEQVRSERGLSRQELADRVDVHYQTIGYLERGEYSPSLALALRIARVLGEPVEAIFQIDEDN
jgi:DNA-binding XRE family transcriptional regulator